MEESQKMSALKFVEKNLFIEYEYEVYFTKEEPVNDKY